MFIDAANGKELMSLNEHSGPVASLAFLADNRTLVSASADKTVRLADVNILAVIDAHADGVAGCAFLPDGVHALSGGADKTVKLWNLTTRKLVKSFGPLPDAVTAVAVSRDGVEVGAAAGSTVTIWKVADGKETATLRHPAEVASLWFSPDKTKIATAAADGFARVWDAATGKELESFPQTGAVAPSSIIRTRRPSSRAAPTRRRPSRRSAWRTGLRPARLSTRWRSRRTEHRF